MMMKKILFIILSLLCVPCVNAKEFPIQKSQKMHSQTWSAQWIESAQNKNDINTWQVFRKEVSLNQIPKEVIAKIAVDSKYWLMINGKQVVFEGGLKRGPSPTDTYYDEINIAPYLQKGNNIIALLTVYFGKEGFSHKDSGHGALLFEAQVGKTCILSNETWDATVYKAYGKIDKFVPNWRLPESNICFDGRKSWGDEWFQESAKMNASVQKYFSKAKVLYADAENKTFGKLVKRPIPLFKDFGLKPYISQHFDEKTRILTCRLPYNAQITPYLKIKGTTEGDTIFIRTDHAKVGSEHCVTAAYITKKGEQEYESLGWMNGDYVYYQIPEGVEVEQVLYRETGYDTEFVSHFHCSDPFFNELWKRSVRTMYVNMRDTYFDCPDRERSQWWGDVCNDIQQSFYVFSPSSWKLVDKGIYELINWQRKDGTLFSPIPAGNWDKELPCQMLQSLGWYGFRAQAFYSGDYSFVPYIYDGMHKYLHEVWQIDEDGFPKVREGGWSFADWGKHIDLQLITIEWYYLALKGELEFAQRLNKQDDAFLIKKMMEKMEQNFNRRFWKGTHYRSESYQDNTIDDRAQALAVLCGFAEKNKFAALKSIFDKSRYASPYLELYVQLALFQMGEGDFALERAKERFSQMLKHKDITTLFEHWGVSASTNHGWSSGMTTILAQEVCGIRPTSEGFKTFEVRPHLAGLTGISTQVETRYGFIKVSIKQEQDQSHMTLVVPKGTKATVIIDQRQKTFKEGTYKI